MKVRDIISKCRLKDTQIEFVENGKVIENTTMEQLWNKKEPQIMSRTLNTWEVKDNKFRIWIKPE
jgi:hypothetical protein